MHVVCKGCGREIRVVGRPDGTTSATGVRAQNVRLGDGGISFGPGGRISFGPGGRVGFGPPAASKFTCFECQATHVYEASEILDG